MNNCLRHPIRGAFSAQSCVGFGRGLMAFRAAYGCYEFMAFLYYSNVSLPMRNKRGEQIGAEAVQES